MTTVISLDAGHTFGKIIMGKKRLMVKTVVAPAHDEAIEGMGMGQVERICTEFGTYFIGDTALRESPHGIVSGYDESWLETPEYKAFVLYCLAGLYSSGTNQVSAHVVSGLPRADFKRHRARLKEALIGDHRIAITDKRPMKISIQDLEYYPQGVLAMLRETPTKNENLGYLEIGGRNVNFALWSRGELVKNPAMTNSSELGALVAVQTVMEIVKDRYGRALNQHEAIEAILAGRVSAFGESHDISGWVPGVMADFTKPIESLSRRAWDLSGLDRLAVGGGAAGWIHPYLNVNHYVVDRPQWATAEGQLIQGSRLWG